MQLCNLFISKYLCEEQIHSCSLLTSLKLHVDWISLTLCSLFCIDLSPSPITSLFLQAAFPLEPSWVYSRLTLSIMVFSWGSSEKKKSWFFSHLNVQLQAKITTSFLQVPWVSPMKVEKWSLLVWLNFFLMMGFPVQFFHYLLCSRLLWRFVVSFLSVPSLLTLLAVLQFAKNVLLHQPTFPNTVPLNLLQNLNFRLPEVFHRL